VDWVSAAAVVALGEWIRAEPSAAIPGRALLIEAVRDLLPHSSEPRFWPLYAALSTIPAVPPSSVGTLKEWHKQHLLPEDTSEDEQG
jgi:hypothetical protein